MKTKVGQAVTLKKQEEIKQILIEGKWLTPHATMAAQVLSEQKCTVTHVSEDGSTVKVTRVDHQKEFLIPAECIASAEELNEEREKEFAALKKESEEFETWVSSLEICDACLKKEQEVNERHKALIERKEAFDKKYATA